MNTIALKPKQAKKRQKVIDVAAQIFVKHGIQGTSMQLLAKRSGIATGSVYNYFESKEALIKEIFHTLVNEEIEFIRIGYDDTASIRERLDYLLSRAVRFKIEHPEKFRFRTQYANTTSFMEEIFNKSLLVGGPWEKLGVDAQAQGIFKNIPLPEVFYFCHGAIAGFVSWKLFVEQNVTEEDIQNLSDMIWGGVTV